MEFLVDLFSTGGMGAITGLIGGWLTKREERKQKVLDYGHTAKMRMVDLKELELEHAQQVLMVDKQIDLAEAEGNIQLDAKEIDAFTASQKGGGKFMDIAKSLVRPLITGFLLFVTFTLYRELDQLVGGLDSLPQEQMIALYGSVIQQIIFLTVTAVAWWFAARPSSQRRMTRAERLGN